MNLDVFLTLRCINLLATKEWLSQFAKELNQQKILTARIDFLNQEFFLFENQMEWVDIQTALTICKQQKVDLILFNACPYRFIYPILTMIQKEDLIKERFLLYPKVVLIAHIVDVHLQNDLKKQAQEMDTECQFVFKRDVPSLSTFDDILIEKGIQYLKQHYFWNKNLLKYNQCIVEQYQYRCKYKPYDNQQHLRFH